ncbi:MAG: hypothetical protein ACOX7D_03890 [Alphaproteobacteria bacterium]|jgi:hypothetical protein
MWKSININIQNIEVETARTILVKCPNKSKYAGWCFWHPSKLVRPGNHSYAKSISYTDDFDFKLVKYGSGKTNKFQVLEEKKISVIDFEEMFYVMDQNIVSPNKDSYLIVEEPEPLTVEGVEIPECLKNN